MKKLCFTNHEGLATDVSLHLTDIQPRTFTYVQLYISNTGTDGPGLYTVAYTTYNPCGSYDQSLFL